MALSRYSFIKKIKIKGKTIVASNRISANIYNAVENNQLEYVTYVLSENERLDVLAGKFYNESSYWWVIAAASGIGWGLQVPPGTFLKIPSNLDDVFRIIT